MNNWDTYGKDCRGSCHGGYAKDSCGKCLSPEDSDYNSCRYSQYSSSSSSSKGGSSVNVTIISVVVVVALLFVIGAATAVWKMYKQQQDMDQKWNKIVLNYQLMDNKLFFDYFVILVNLIKIQVLFEYIQNCYLISKEFCQSNITQTLQFQPYLKIIKKLFEPILCLPDSIIQYNAKEILIFPSKNIYKYCSFKYDFCFIKSFNKIFKFLKISKYLIKQKLYLKLHYL
ncbi:hypothetical protein RFI_31761 [Reticulomyxa filosa]|uniref:Transmembrane protein n=1 Tax=Reticulomyxa filosa TaxID=46433 RepID=X6LWW1_RETFI|nr:hypothetical protein RFI_31761 [Reticulomyxa filosa]|eukprot:ETO05637.1 hypothetical protein RFI_31761 [Reticulomyxa filosa]